MFLVSYVYFSILQQTPGHDRHHGEDPKRLLDAAVQVLHARKIVSGDVAVAVAVALKYLVKLILT